MSPPPSGRRLALDRSVARFRDGRVLVGGQPGRLITLTEEGTATLDDLLDGATDAGGAPALTRRLVEAGMAHPPAATADSATAGHRVTVVVPVRDRPLDLERCLRSLGSTCPVVVVDDGSVDGAAVAAVCRRHGARLIVRAVNGGPGAARNDGLVGLDTDLVAFVDSDCTVTDGWLAGLLGLFDDPAVAAVAPRVRPRAGDPGPTGRPARRTALERFSAAHSPLDLGPEASEVGSGRRVTYVPTAALLVRRTVLADGFDTRMRVGEDVDLVWRLLDDGWRVRYEPSVTVFHQEPGSWVALLRRRYHYGTSAGPLAERHPGRLAPLVLRPWSTAIVAAVLARRVAAAAALLAASALVTHRRVRGHGIPLTVTLRWSAASAGGTLTGMGRTATMLAAPALVVGALRNRRSAAIVALLVLAGPLSDWWHRRPGLDPLRWTAAATADDVAYGAGVWAGCLRSRTLAPLLPAVAATRAATRAAVDSTE